MLSMFKVVNVNLNRTFYRCQCRCQNLFLIVLVFLIISFSGPVFSSAVADDGRWWLDQAKTELRELEVKSQKPNVLKKPVLVGGLGTGGTARKVAVVGEYAYVADGCHGLKVINVADKTSPVLVGSLDLDDEARRVPS